MRRQVCFFEATVRVAAVPARKKWRTKVTVLFFACLLTATGMVNAKKPAPPPETIGGNGTVPIGLAVFPDQKAYQDFGAAELRRMADEFVLAANDTAIRSGVSAQYVLTTLQQTNIVNAGNRNDPLKIALAAIGSKALRGVMATSGADIAQIWPNSQIRGQAPVPTARSAFKPDNGFSVSAAGGWVIGKVHELFHLLGLRHNPEQYQTPTTSILPGVFGYLRGDGACDVMSYCSNPLLVLSGPNTGMGDLQHNNVSMAQLSAPWVAAYNANRPRSLVRSCDENMETSCLSRFQVKVRWVARDPQAPSPAGWARVIPGSNDTAASFDLSGGTVVKVARTSRTVGGTVVTDFAIVSGPTSVSYRVTLTDTATGYGYGWGVKVGQSANLNLLAVF